MYLTSDSTDAYLDFPEPRTVPEHNKTCPKCQGHGGWNLKLNEYPLHQYANTPENRHRYSHFRCCCSNCNGWGYVPESQVCVHDFVRTGSAGMCSPEFTCKRCKKIIIMDSSG